jgi:hypothetical protein
MEIKERGNWGSQFGFIAAAAVWWRSICISIFTFCSFNLYPHYEFRIQHLY